MPWLTPDNDNAPVICRRVFIPNQFLPMLDGALTLLTLVYQWEKFGAMTPEECADSMLEVYNRYLQDECPVTIGVILPFATTDPPQGSLECNGATYNRVDYPLLYAALDSVFIIDADTFQVPDLRSRAVIAAGQGSGLSNYGVGDTGGTESVILSDGEMPIHSHGNFPHSHSEITSVPTAITIGAGVPAPSAIPGVGVTGLTSISIDNAGGSQPHENRQPYFALRYCIYWV